MSGLDLRALIIANQGISKIQLCRLANKQDLSYCRLCKYYANQRKRDKGLAYDPVCEHRWPKIRYRVKVMPDIVEAKIKRPDHYQGRGWDWMRCLFIPVYEDKDQVPQ